MREKTNHLYVDSQERNLLLHSLKGELNSMRDVLGEIQSDMYKSLEKNKPAKSKEQER